MRPDPITKRISAVPPFKWRDVSNICRAETLITDLPTTYENFPLRPLLVHTNRLLFELVKS